MVISSYEKIAVSIQNRNIEILATYMDKVSKGMSRPHKTDSITLIFFNHL